jgi:hypothetical protein
VPFNSLFSSQGECNKEAAKQALSLSDIPDISKE